MPYAFFLFKEGGASKKLLLWGGPCEKKSEIGGVMQFSNYTPPKPTSPPYPIKNERFLIWLSSYREQKEAKLWMPDLRHCTHGQKPKKQRNVKMTQMITWAMTSSWHQRKAEKDEEEAMPLSSYKSRVKRKRNGSKRKWSTAGRWLRLRWSGKIYFNTSCKCSNSKCNRCRLWC